MLHNAVSLGLSKHRPCPSIQLNHVKDELLHVWLHRLQRTLQAAAGGQEVSRRCRGGGQKVGKRWAEGADEVGRRWAVGAEGAVRRWGEGGQEVSRM